MCLAQGFFIIVRKLRNIHIKFDSFKLYGLAGSIRGLFAGVTGGAGDCEYIKVYLE